MKNSKILALSGAMLMSLSSLTTFAIQGGQTPGTQSADTKNSKNLTTPNTANRQEDINNSGSSAQVRHDRTGSLNPGNVGPKGTTGASNVKKAKPQ